MPPDVFAYPEIFDAYPVAATLVDRDAVIVDVNRAFLDYTGSLGLAVRREERVGHPLVEFAVEDRERDQLEGITRKAIASGETQHLRMRWPNPVGHPAFLDLTVEPVTTREGEVKGAVILRHNVSEAEWAQRRRHVTSRVRDEVWRMGPSGDMSRVLAAVRDGLEELGVPFDSCTMSLIAEHDDGLHVSTHGVSSDGSWTEAVLQDESRQALESIWRGAEPSYRRDLEQEDLFGEGAAIAEHYGKPIRAILDVPLPQGTLAINSTEAHAFTPEDIEVLKEMANVLAEGFARMADFRALEDRNQALEREVQERRQAEEALAAEHQRLRASEARYRQLVDNLPIGIAHTTPEGRTLYVNPRARQIFGYGDDSLESLRAHSLYVHLEDRRDLTTNLAKRGEHSYEYLLRRRDGEPIWVRGTTSALRDDEGSIVEFQGFMEDVTEQRRQSSEAEAIRRVRDAVWQMRQASDIQRVLEATEESLIDRGVDYHGLGLNVVDGSVEPPRVTFYETTRDHDRGRWNVQAQTDEDIVITEAWRRGEINYRPDLDAEDSFGEKRGLAQDYGAGIRSVIDVPFSRGTLAVNSRRPNAFGEPAVAFLRRLAEALSEGLQRLHDLEEQEQRAVEAEALARAIGAVAGSRDLQEALRTVVEEAAHLMSCERGVLFLHDPDEGVLIPRAQVGHDWEHYQHVRLRPGESVSGKVFSTGVPELGQDDPRKFPLRQEMAKHFEASLAGEPAGSGSVVPLRLDGQVIGTLAVGHSRRPPEPRDIELLERLGEQAVLAVDRSRRATELEHRARDLEDQIAAAQRLEEQLLQAQKMEAIGQLTAGIAHNFNNLLQAVIGNLSLAAEEVGGSPREMLRDAESSALRGAEMVRQLLMFSRQSVRPEYVPVEVQSLVDDALAICRKTFDRGIDLDAELPPELPGVLGHRGQLEQALLNLLINARDALGDAGTRRPQISISAGLVVVSGDEATDVDVDPGEYVRLAVTDNGPGMDEKTRQQIFDPFFSTKEVGAGTGLGLSTVYGIVRQHDGWVECQARPEAGAVFALHLPAVAVERAVPAQSPGAPAGGSETILVVDDEEPVRRTTARMLEHFGYTVLATGEGEAALKMIGEGTVDLVLLDLSMPGMSGIEVNQVLRESGSQVKVVLFTGYAAGSRDAGPADGVIQKPFTADAIAREVRRVLG